MKEKAVEKESAIPAVALFCAMYTQLARFVVHAIR